MNFGEAINSLKEGCFVSRSGWNPGGMFVFFGVPKVEINHDNGHSVSSVDPAELFAIKYSSPVMCLKDDKNKIVVGWTPSQKDMLEDDWHEVGKKRHAEKV